VVASRYFAIGEDKKIYIKGEVFSLEKLLTTCSPYSDEYGFERYIVQDINDQGEIVGLGYIWGDAYPFIGRPHDAG